jgi:hypothetical protein
MKTKNLTKRNNIINVSFDSSVLAAAAYSSRDRVLLVAFRNGELFRYRKVPHLTATGLMMNSSPGTYFNKNIRHTYNGVKQ